MIESPRHAVVILGRRAASDESFLDLLNSARAQGHALDILRTPHTDSLSRTLCDLAVDNVGRVIVCGGDGTLNLALNALAQCDPKVKLQLGLVPYGTGNDFARALGLPLDDPERALAIALNGAVANVDVIRCNNRYFINMATGGPVAGITTSTSQDAKELLGGMAYLLQGLRNLPDLAPVSLKVEAHGFTWEGDAFGYYVGNGNTSGGGAAMCPEARIDDGLLDLMIVPAVGVFDILGAVGEGIASALGDEEANGGEELLVRHRARSLSVTTPQAVQVNLDGEPISSTSFLYRVEPASLAFATGGH